MVDVGKTPSKVNMHKSITYLNPSPILECCVIMCESKNRCQKDACLKEIGLCAQVLLTIPGSTINIIEGLGGWGRGEC